MTMPEEINRLVTDRISDLLLTPDRMSNENLRKEGVNENKIGFVGNIMIDTLVDNRQKAEQLSVNDIIHSNLIEPKSELPDFSRQFAMVTLHRPSNVDHEHILSALIDFFIVDVTPTMPVVWSIHPRTHKHLKSFGLWDKLISNSNIILLHPIGYHEMLKMNIESRVMLTDSGGLQEECTVIGTPCLTMRWNTERPVTLTEHGGVSILVGNNVERIREEYLNILAKESVAVTPELWDGKTAQRCLDALLNYRD
jgi:UDP-N-acetylglucosamine 2-epimerase (non-hydrolysing)